MATDDRERRQADGMPIWLWIVIGVVVLLGAFLAWGSRLASTPEGQARAQERDAIAECRRQVDDDLQDRSTRRFVRGVCEKLEADYRRKWNRNP